MMQYNHAIQWALMSIPFHSGSVLAGIVCVLLFSLLSKHSSATELKPFTSDGCSAFPDGTLEQKELWLKCCVAHDYAYWKGGTWQQRLDADLELRKCVSAVGAEEISLLMLAGVRVGGSPFFPTAFRWGYGWPYPAFYGELSAEELEQIKSVTKSTNGQD